MHTVTKMCQFHKKFCSEIRVIFNWRRFLVEDWQIVITRFQDQKAFSTLQRPWYFGEGENGFVSYYAADASPVCLADIKEWYPLLCEEKRNVIDNMKKEPPQFAHTQIRVSCVCSAKTRLL